MLYGLYRLIVYAFIIYLIIVFIRYLRKPFETSKKTNAPRPTSGTMVKDEVCNTYLPKEEAIRDVIKGRELFFCSQECRKQFKEKTG